MKTTIVLNFIKAINQADVDALCRLMTDDHVFIDSQDHPVRGKDTMKQAWIHYFSLFQNYKIDIDEMIENDSLIYFFGHASGSYKGHSWRIPAAWRATVHGDHIQCWQVYADNMIVADIINRNQ